MKQIKAFIQPHRLEAVEARLSRIDGLPGLAITRVEGYGRTDEGAA